MYQQQTHPSMCHKAPSALSSPLINNKSTFHLESVLLFALVLIYPSVSWVTGQSCGSGSAAYGPLVSDSDIKSHLRLADNLRGVIQVMSTFSTSVIQRPGIAGTLAAIQEAERENLLPFHILNMTTAIHQDYMTNFTLADEFGLNIAKDIVENTGNSATFPYTAVVNLEYHIADVVVNTLASNENTSRLPILNPVVTNGAYFTNSHPNILHYKPTFVSELLHLLSFAFTNLDCATTDIHLSIVGSLDQFVESIQSVYTSAGFPIPTVIVTPRDTTNSTANEIFIEEVLTEGMEGRNAKCVFVLDVFRHDLYTLLRSDSRGANFFATTSLLHFSSGAETIPPLNSSEASVYENAYFASTEPDDSGSSTVATNYQAALAIFNSNHSEADHKRMNGGEIVDASVSGGYYAGDVTDTSPFGLQSYSVMRWLLELLSVATPKPKQIVRTKMIKQGVCNITDLDLSTAFTTSDYPLASPSIDDVKAAAFSTRTLISDDFSVGPLTPTQCLTTYGTTESNCFCNVGTKILYVSRYNTTKRELDFHQPTNDFGPDVDITSIVPERQCSLTTDDISSSFPSTLCFIDSSNASTDFNIDTVTSRMFSALSSYVNTIGEALLTTTVRAATVTATGYTEYETQQAFAEVVNTTSPFMVLGSTTELSFLMESSASTPLEPTTASGNYVPVSASISVTPTFDILSLMNGIDVYTLEDPPLVASSAWNRAHVSLRATFADHTHAIVSYYFSSAEGTSPPTSLSIIVETSAQADLVKKSFATFQLSVSVTTLDSLGGTTSEFRNWIASAIDTGGDRPFIFVGLMTATDLALELLHIINGTVGLAATTSKDGLRFGLAAAEDTVYELFEYTTSNAFITITNSLRQGFTLDMFIEATASNTSAESFFTRTRPLSTITGDIVFATHLDEWYLPRSTVAIAHPGLFRRFEVVRVASSILSAISSASATTAAGILYEIINVAGVATTYGPFYSTACSESVVADNNRDRSCQCAKGPRTFQVLSFTDFYFLQSSSRTSQYSYTNEGCGVVYREISPSSSSLSTWDIVGIALGFVFFVAIIVGLLVGFYCCRRRYAVRHAPKDSSLPFAMAFTDIQSSTTLWARVPEAMAASVDAHHMLLRESVDKYNGYEVKTIGDSFMVAFHTAEAAATFALGVQIKLFSYHLWAPEIDETYIETLFEAHKRAQENDNDTMSLQDGSLSHGSPLTPGLTNSKTGTPSSSIFLPLDPDTGELDNDKYEHVWCGLRVRVGVHFGVGDIKRDPVSGRFDYYGTVVNTAARVEGVGHGGQVLLTEDAFRSLPQDFEATHSVSVIDMGPQPLRGLDAPVTLFQFTPKSLAGRLYPPLRLDVEKVAEEINTDEDNSEDSNSNSSNASSGNQSIVAFNQFRKKYLTTVDPWSPEAIADKIVAKELKLTMIKNTKSGSRGSESNSVAGSVGQSSSFPRSSVIAQESPHEEGEKADGSIWDREPEIEMETPENEEQLQQGHPRSSQSHPVIGAPTSPYSPATAKTQRTPKDAEPQKQVDILVKQQNSARENLLTLYFFMDTALSTSTPAHRLESVSHMAKKWHIRKTRPSIKLRKSLAKKNAGSRQASLSSQTKLQITNDAANQSEDAKDEAYNQMYLLMGLCLKIGKAAPLRQAQITKKFR